MRTYGLLKTYRLRSFLLTVLVSGTAAWGGGEATAPVTDVPESDAEETFGLCDLPLNLTGSGNFIESIPALTEPTFIGPESEGYLIDSDRVLGLVVDGDMWRYFETGNHLESRRHRRGRIAGAGAARSGGRGVCTLLVRVEAIPTRLGDLAVELATPLHDKSTHQVGASRSERGGDSFIHRPRGAGSTPD